MIAIHGPKPPRYPAQSYQHAERMDIPDLRGVERDVWKTIVYLRSHRKDLDVFVLDCDQGLGVIVKRKPDSGLHYSGEEIDRLSYKDLDNKREHLLNLKRQEYFHEFLPTLHRGANT